MTAFFSFSPYYNGKSYQTITNYLLLILLYCLFYNIAMKRLIIIFCLLFTVSLWGCGKVSGDITMDAPNINAPSNDFVPSLPEFEENEEKKKYYAVSTVNGLRIRASASTSGTVVGTLDKNDAVVFTEKVNDFYKTIYKEKVAYVYAPYCDIMEISAEEDKIEKAIELGASLLGYPYVWGSQRYHWGNGKLNSDYVHGKYDCSALVLYIYYKTNGVILDVTSRAQAYNGTAVNKSDLKRGDLMFFTNESRKNLSGNERIGHVGIYFGNNYILHTASDHAVIEPISNTRWGYYITARRVV